MKNRFGIPADVLHRMAARDINCVYCGKEFAANSPKDKRSIEHLNEKPPIHWSEGLKEEGLAYCCISCNSSRGDMSLTDWFRTGYCTDRLICADSVAEPVKRYLRSLVSAPGAVGPFEN